MKQINEWTREELAEEMAHFQEVASLALPNSYNFTKLPGIDYFVGITPYKGSVGGDHVAIVNFSEYGLKKKIKDAYDAGREDLAKTLEKNLNRLGIMVADVAGHMLTDYVIANYLQGAFKIGVDYELRLNGEITPSLFELINMTFYNRIRDTVKKKPYLTLVYGEIDTDGRFRYLLAGHPAPLVFSQERDRIEKLDGDRRKASTPMGIFPSKYHPNAGHFEPATLMQEGFDVNEIHLLGSGDVMLLYTDGLTEQSNGKEDFGDSRLEQVLREVKSGTAKEIYEALTREVLKFGTQEDDITIAVVKKK